MKFPERTESHTKETDACKIFEAAAPSSWIVRNLTERDYGIDYYVEITSSGQVTGDLCSIQVKGTGKLSWESDAEKKPVRSVISGVQTSTVNYWMGLPVPVFIINVDLSEKVAYFAPAKYQVREQFKAFQEQASMSFSFLPGARLGTDPGTKLFEALYRHEKAFPTFEHYFRELLIHGEAYREHIEINQNRDPHLLVEPEQLVLTLHLYRLCSSLRGALSLKCAVPDYLKIFKEDREAFLDGGYLHELGHDKALRGLKPVLEEAIEAVMGHMRDNEFYWLNTDFPLHLMWKSVRR